MNWPIQHCPICNSKNHSLYKEVVDHSISKEIFELVECGDCHFIWTKNAPDPEKIGPYYESEEYISHSDTKTGLIPRLYHAVRQLMLEKKRAWVEDHTSDKGHLLDIGSGTGYFLNEMKNAQWSVEGIEVNDSAREASKSEFDLKVSPLKALYEFDQSKFDVITMWHVLEHVHDLNGYWEIFKKILKPNGTILIAVPNITSHDARYYDQYWAALDVPRHLWHFKPIDIQRLGANHGFKIVDTIGMPLDGYYVSMLSERYKNSAMGSLKGAWRGLISRIKAGSSTKMSSVVYILKQS